MIIKTKEGIGQGYNQTRNSQNEQRVLCIKLSVSKVGRPLRQ